MDDLIVNKLEALLVVMILALSFSLLPLSLRNLLLRRSIFSEKYTTITLSAFLCFGAGILMSIVFLHILVEVRQGFDDMMRHHLIREFDYPLAELILCLGFFLLYFLDEIAHYYVEHKPPSTASKNDCLENSKVGSFDGSCIEESNEFDISLRESDRNCNNDSSSSSSNSSNSSNRVKKSEDGIIKSGAYCMRINLMQNKNVDTVRRCISDTNSPQSSEELSQTDPSIDVEKNSKVPLIRSVLVISALSLHGAFEGLSLGLEEHISQVWLLCAALASHKVFIGFSTGMELLEIGIKRLQYAIQILIFSFASPIGALVGITLKESIEERDYVGRTVIGVLQGLSGGAILYITFCEILERERTKPLGRFVRLLALIAGFLIMATLVEVASHKHEHSKRFSITNNVNDSQNNDDVLFALE